MHALDATPADGVALGTFGRRAAVAGLKRTDIIVGVDGWRVRTADQLRVVSRLKFDDLITFTVWRDGAYKQVHARVPERWLGTRFVDHRGKPRA
jgi:S1-C subfamily serine protease